MPDTSITILPEEAAALIDLITTRYHTVHRAELPDLIRLARGLPEAPRGLVVLLERMRTNLEAHMQREEDGLFPAMREAEPVSSAAIEIMRDEHDDHAGHLRDLAHLTNDHTAPESAGAEGRLLYAGTRKLADDLAEHIRLENDMLFPRFTD
jgi:regulator of cell morphogenesis and NO signaling